MAFRHDHDKTIPRPPRVKDLPKRLTAGVPTVPRTAGGRFAPGNKAATEHNVKAIIKRHLGGSGADDSLVEKYYRDSLVMYRSFLRELPAGSATVGELLAREARWAVLSAHYATLAAAKTDPSEGTKLLELSLKMCSRSERLAVTAWDLSQRLMKAKQTRTQRSGFDAIEAEAERIAERDDTPDDDVDIDAEPDEVESAPVAGGDD